MPINRGSISELLAPDLHQVYIETGKERPVEYELFFNTEAMEWNPMTDQQVSGLGTLLSKPDGEQFSLDDFLIGNTVSYTASPFGLAIEITWEAWRDELYGVLREMTAELARASRQKQETEAWDILNDAFDGNTYTGFDSTALCSTSHTGLDGTDRSNMPSSPTGLSQTYIQNAINRFENMTDERNNPRLMAPVMLVIDPADKFTAREILGSGHKPYTADNEINALVAEDLRWMVCHYLTDATSAFLSAQKGQHDLNFFWRDRPIFDMFDDPWSKNAIATVYQRHTQGFGTWRGIDGTYTA